MSEVEDALDRVLFVGGHGFVTALDKMSGDEIWRTSLKGSGYGFVNLLLEKDHIFAASGGKMYCISADHGEVLWMNPMPKLGYGIYSFATTSQPGSSIPAAVASQQSQQQASQGSGGAT